MRNQGCCLLQAPSVGSPCLLHHCSTCVNSRASFRKEGSDFVCSYIPELRQWVLSAERGQKPLSGTLTNLWFSCFFSDSSCSWESLLCGWKVPAARSLLCVSYLDLEAPKAIIWSFLFLWVVWDSPLCILSAPETMGPNCDSLSVRGVCMCACVWFVYFF